MKNLPIGISTLSTIIENKMIYVDKTEIAYRLIAAPGRYFLARPRRFGKSLFIDTLKEIFVGSKELFKGLFIYDNWNWNKIYPVIKFDFAGGIVNSKKELDIMLYEKMSEVKREFSILTEATSVSGTFKEIITKLYEKYNSKVVLLIDEYDKPLLDNIENPVMAMEVRDGLKNLYSVIKEQDANLQFVFLTGVSKFSKVSIFSGINNLEDITLNPDYATICGYTQKDLETNFNQHIDVVDMGQLKEWYNGYNFLGDKVYNPFDILLFISNQKTFKNYWFETGSPTFLIKLFQKNNYFLPDLDAIEVGEELLSSFEIDRIEPSTLLFQSGYLTIKETKIISDKLAFKLGFPNREVRISFNEYLITGYTDISAEKLRYEESIYNSFMNSDMDLLHNAITRLFAAIPYRNFTNNDLLNFEGYYASVLYAFFAAINCEVIPEDITNKGQADMTVKLGNTICIMEVKVGTTKQKGKNEALLQIKKMNYSEKYKHIPGKNVFELGMVFDAEKRNLVKFNWIKL